jgi:hypothetical protein
MTEIIKIMVRTPGTPYYGEAKPVYLWENYLVCKAPCEDRKIYVHDEILREAFEVGANRLWFE